MRKVIAIAGVAGLSLVWAAVPAGAGNNPNFVSSPTKGPPGTVIHASDHNFGCDSIGATVRVDLVDQNEHTVIEVQTHVTDASIWDADLTVPDGTPPGGYVITVDCIDGEFQVFYSNNEFVVTAAAATTTTTTSTTIAPAAVTTTTTVPPAPVVPAATPAAPVVASPALTG
jgi:hypothetical protein